MAFSNTYLERGKVEPRYVLMTVLAQDPSVKNKHGVLRAQVRVPAGRLEAGPRSARFHVVNYDATSGFLTPAADLCAPDASGEMAYVDRFVDMTDKELLHDPGFHAQHVYAVAARTLGRFEFALGRRLAWGFGAHQIYLVPHAFVEANAFYSFEDHAVMFGYFLGPRDTTVWTCLSHDVVADETTHAILDGLRHRFLEPGLPDQGAFHEALADIVALLSVFALPEVVEELLGKSIRGKINADAVTSDQLRKGPLLGLGEQMGSVLLQGKGSLRQSALLEPGIEWQSDLAFEEPHLRGEVLVAAILDVLVLMWTGRLEDLIANQQLSRTRAAEEGAKAADHLVTMVIRAIDYLPPVEFEYADFLDAVLISDAEVAPDDEHHYRDALTTAFAGFGIERPVGGRIIDLSDGNWSPRYHGMNFMALRSDADEVFRFMWENAAQTRAQHRVLHPCRIRSARVSVGPDGLVINETVVDYIQMLDVTIDEFLTLAPRWPVYDGGLPASLHCPEGVEGTTRVQLLGGGTLIFDQFGRAKYHVRKPLDDARRQMRRLDFLVRAGQIDHSGRLGFSTGAQAGQAIADLHTPSVRAGDDW